MKKTIIISIAAAVVIGGGVLAYVLLQPETPDGSKRDIPVLSDTIDNQFALKADQQDSLGVETVSTFTLTSEKPIEKDLITGNLVIEPSMKYKIESSDSNTFTIVPEEALEADTIYTFSMLTQPEGETVKREYNWAYQIKETFKIAGTLPRDETTSVPTNSGIEIYFSHENYTDYENYITISPAVEGRFEQYRKTLVFVPDSLASETVYTVTVKQGLPLSGSELTLADDYTFQFETEREAGRNYSYLSFDKQFYEYPTSEAPIVTLQEYNTGLDNIVVTVYGFSSFSEFTGTVATRDSLPRWAYYAIDQNPISTDGLNIVSTFTATKQSTDYETYLEFPEALPQGYYLVEIIYNDKPAQTFLQVGNMAASYQGGGQNSFIWVHDLGSGQPVIDAAVGYSRNSEFSANTDADGIALFDTPDDITTSSNNQVVGTPFYTVDTGDQQLLVPLTYRYYGFNYHSNIAPRDYWAYLYVNRTLYAPTDSLKFWGVLKPRTGKATLDEVTVELIKSSRYYGGDDVVIKSQTVDISSYGTLLGEFDFTNLNPGYYTLRAMVGDETIVSEGVNIGTFTKPAYKIEITTPKKAIFEGEEAVFDIRAQFFDGTPVSNMALSYTSGFGDGSVTTDTRGQAQVVFQTDYSYDDYYPNHIYFSVHPEQAELADTTAEATLYTFGPHAMISAQGKNDGTVSGTVNEVVLDNLNAEADDFTWDYEGEPIANATVNLSIIHEYYTKTETGTRYDFINKKTYKTYDYQHHTDLVEEGSTMTDADGEYTYSFTAEEDSNYRIYLTTIDTDGREAQTNAYIHSGIQRTGYRQGYDNYYIAVDAGDDQYSTTYQPGENATVSFYKNEEVLPETETSQYVYFKGQQNFFDVIATDQPTNSFTFQESYVPNIYVYGLYFDGRNYHLTNPLKLHYDQSLKALQLDIQLDEEAYRPGDTVNLTVTATDPDSNPARGEINVSAIDEALTAIQWENDPDILDTLYESLPVPLTMAYQSHETLKAPMAEGGGCFTGGTPILMADGSRKPIADVQVGDMVLTRQSPDNPALVAARVKGTTQHFVDTYLEINNSLKVTPEHIVYLNGRWQPIGTAHIGDSLVNADGQTVTIFSVRERHLADSVYNLSIDKYHTFIADNVYVHNNKAPLRQDFQDIAYFGSQETDRNGQATFQFELPDNVTAWQTTVHGITADLKAGATQTAVIATLPFYIDASVASDYVVGDKPIIKIRGVGAGVATEQTVTYNISYPGYSNEIITTTGAPYEMVQVALPEDFSAGEHSIKIEAEAGQYADAIQKSFTYHQSNILDSVVNYYALADDPEIAGSDTLNTTLTFTNLERGQYYRTLRRLTWQYGDRIDQRLARYQAGRLLEEYFDETSRSESFQFTDYQVEEGGIALLPYSSAELLLTAKVMEVGSDLFDSESATLYFQQVLDATDSNIDEIVYALFGLANLGEPVLTDINLLLDNHEIEPQLKLYLIRGIANLGATEYAVSLLEGIIQEYGEYAEPYLRLNLGETRDDYIESTYQAAIVAAAVSSENAGELFGYALANRAQYQLNTIEKIAYIQTALPLLSGDPVSFTYMLEGVSKDITLENSDTYTLLVTPGQLADISFQNISGAVGLVASYQEPVNIAEEPVDNQLSIQRSYSVDGRATAAFQEGDIIKVTITPTINTNAIDNSYQLTDYIPGGLKLLTNLRSRGLNYDKYLRYPYEVNGQALKFWSGKPGQAFHYYATVISKGLFIAEPPSIQGFVVKESKNFGQLQNVTIE